MDKHAKLIIKKIWAHHAKGGYVWTPHIKDIASSYRFVEGRAHQTSDLTLPHLTEEDDWYFTPAVAEEPSRKKTSYGAQRVVWVDCDEGYDYDKLVSLSPTFLWETSPKHFQAVWLLRDAVPASEFSANGIIGLITQVTGADKSGVDIGQLLRIPGTHHHKRGEFKGRIVQTSKLRLSLSDLLRKVITAAGGDKRLASEIASPEPYGDRSKQLWKFSNNLARAGVDEELTFKIIRASKWNKWKDDDNALRQDVRSAYEQPQPDKYKTKQAASPSQEEESEDISSPISLKKVGDFGRVLREPVRWVVPGIIPEAGCGLIIAPPKVGKTRIAIEIAVGAATGDSPIGLAVQRRRRVAFLSLEDGEYLFSMRLDHALNMKTSRTQYHWDGHITPELQWEPPVTMPLNLSFEQVDLSSDEDKQRLADLVVDNGIDLLIIDTLSMAVGKKDVNNSSEMYEILKDVKVIAKEAQCAVAFIHHTRKRMFDKGESIQERILGSTALHAWSDFLISLSPPEEGSELMPVVVQTKMGGKRFLVDNDLQIIPESSKKDNPS